MPQVHYMSQEGLDKIKKELEEAIAQRPVIAAQIAEAREKGDLSENAEYESAREAQGLLELKIANLQNTIVGEKEADFSKGKLAATTPIAKALIGHGKGEVVEAQVPAGAIKFEILEISF